MEKITYTLPNDIEVELKMLDVDCFERITRWLRREYIRNIRDVIQDFPKNEQDKLIASAVREAVLLDARNDKGLELLGSLPQGFSRMVFELIVNPPFSFESFHNIIFNSDTEKAEEKVLRGVEIVSAMFYKVYGESFVDEAVKILGPEILKDAGLEVAENDDGNAE